MLKNTVNEHVRAAKTHEQKYGMIISLSVRMDLFRIR